MGTCDHIDWAQSVIDGDAKFTAEFGYGTIDELECSATALVDNNGNVYHAWMSNGIEPHTENYKDYIKRVTEDDE